MATRLGVSSGEALVGNIGHLEQGTFVLRRLERVRLKGKECRHFVTSPPPAGWGGAFATTTK